MESVVTQDTYDTATHPCDKPSFGSKRLSGLRYAGANFARDDTELHPNSDSERIQCSREKREIGSNGFLLTRAADSPLSLKDTSDVLKSPSRYNNDRTQQCPKKTPDVQGFCLEGTKSKDTMKLNEPIAHQMRLKIQQPSKPKGKAKLDTEVREMFL